jgi:hypothetical protein
MITLIDEMYDRGYQAARADLNAGLGRALTGVGAELGRTLKVLHRIEWTAPWAAKDKDVGHA